MHYIVAVLIMEACRHWFAALLSLLSILVKNVNMTDDQHVLIYSEPSCVGMLNKPKHHECVQIPNESSSNRRHMENIQQIKANLQRIISPSGNLWI